MQLFHRSVSSGQGPDPVETSPVKEQADEPSLRLDELRETVEEIRLTNPDITSAALNQLAIKRMAEKRRGRVSTAKELLAGKTAVPSTSRDEPHLRRSILDQVRSGGERLIHDTLHLGGNSGNLRGSVTLGDSLRSGGHGSESHAAGPQYLMRRESHRDPFLNVNRADLMKELSGLDLDDSSASSGEPMGPHKRTSSAASGPGLAASMGASDRSLELRDIEGGAEAAQPKNEGADGARAAQSAAAAATGVMRGMRRRSSVQIRRSSGLSLRSIREAQGPGEAGESDEDEPGKQKFDDSLDGSGDLVIDEGALICQWRRNSGISIGDVKLTSNDDSLSDVSDSGLICGWRSRRFSDLSVDDDFNASSGSGLSAD